MSLRIRQLPSVACAVVSVTGLYLGLLAPSGAVPVPDKAQHFAFFYLMGLSLYWVLDISRKRAMQLTIAALLSASILSEVVQSYVTTREFDVYDIVANLLGSGLSLLFNTLYHVRMLRRKREAKYVSVGMTDLEGGATLDPLKHTSDLSLSDDTETSAGESESKPQG